MFTRWFRRVRPLLKCCWSRKRLAGSEYDTLEVTGDLDRIDAIPGLLKPMGIKEIARTGTIMLSREKRK